MSTAALDINDAGIAVVKNGELLTGSPGYPWFGRGPSCQTVLSGDTARRAARLEAMSVENRFWAWLDQQPLSQRQAACRSSADIAYLQLNQLKEQLGSGVTSVVFAVPPTMR